MRNLKRVLSLALALVMVLGMMVITTSAADFTDADEITYPEAVEVMTAIGILKGFPDGTFAPKATLTREQAAKILAFVCLGTDADNYLTGSAAPFEDVAATKWSAKYIAYCKNLGIVNGVNASQTLFDPAGTLTVVQFAKMLLEAIEVDGIYTGAGWEENVKDAVATVPEMAATGIKISNAEITREEACELALAAMKHGEEYSNGYYYEGYKDEFGYEETWTDMYVKAKTMLEGETDGEGNPVFNKNNIKKHSDKKNTLLGDTYEVTFNPDDADKFGRPGNSYTYEVEGAEEPVVLFFADKALAKFEGPVAEQDIFAASGAKKVDSIPYTIIQDGVNINAWVAEADRTAYKAGEDGADQAAPGTGYGIKTELYLDGTEYKLISIREYLGTVIDIDEADAKDPTSKRTITIDVACLPEDNDTDGKVTLATEDYAKKDVVIVTVAGNKVQTIAAAKSVSGTPTKIASGVVTIAGNEYVNSQNASGVTVKLGTAGSWYVDSFGNLMGTVSIQEEKAAEYYGVLLDLDGKMYKAEQTDEGLLGEVKTEGQEANEVVKILTAEGKEVLYTTAWKYLYEDETDETKITGVDFVIGGEQDVENSEYSWTSSTLGKDMLVKYTLDENGKVKTIEAAGADGSTTGKLEAGKAIVGALADVVTDNTLFFLKVTTGTGTPKWVAYNGYKTVPGVKDFTSVTTVSNLVPGTTDSNGTYAIVMIAGTADEVVEETTVFDYIYFADNTYTEEWDATANEGKGAVVYVYENVYLNGEKTTVSFTSVLPAAKGALYAYETNAKTGAMDITWSNLVVETEKVSLVQADFFKAGSTIHYVNADTVYYQIDAKTGLTKVAALPEVDTDETIVVKYVLSETLANKDVVAADVYFTVEETEKIDTSVTTVATADELKAAEGKVVLTADITLTEALTIAGTVTLDGNGYTITSAVEDVLQVTGTLTLGEGTTIESTNSILWAKGGTINIEGATLESTSTENALGYAGSGGKINLKSGSVKAYWTGLTADGAGSQVNITGGTLESTNSNGVLSKNGATATISGGTVKTGDFVTLWVKESGNMVVTGGNFIVGATSVISNEGGTVSVSGGTFAKDPSAHVASGYKVTGAGPYTVVAE